MEGCVFIMSERDILCSFSGGGYRATFFHAGVLRKLVDFGLKNRIKTISSVSGGSIVSALFGVYFDEIQTVESYDRLIIAPLIQFSQKNIRNKLLLYKPLTLLKIKSNNGIMIEQLNHDLFHGKTIDDFSKNVQIIINATNLNDGIGWQFTNQNFGDDRTGYSYDVENIPIALAVTASACFPGLFSPIKLNIQDYKFYHKNKNRKDDPIPNVTPNFVYLADGGIFDNLGYFSLEQEFEQNSDALFIVSDAATRFKQNQKIYYFLNEAVRIIDILMAQIVSRDRKIISCDMELKKWQGIYMKMESSCRFYRELEANKEGISENLPQIGWSDSVVERIAKMRTDLNTFTESEIQALVCHGETLVETSIAKWHSAFYQTLSRGESVGYYTDMKKNEKKIFDKLEKSKELVKL